MKPSLLVASLLGLVAGASHAATTFSIFNNVPNGSASGGSGSGVGALNTTAAGATIVSDVGLPVATYTISNVDLTAEGGTANETVTVQITYSTTDSATIAYSGFGAVGLNSSGSNNGIINQGAGGGGWRPT